MARQPGAAVDIDLAAVVIFARLAAHGLRCVRGTDRVDAAVLDAIVHEIDQVRPDGIELRAVELRARDEGGEPLAEQHLRAVDIAHTSKEALVHEHRADAAPRGMHAGPQRIRVGVCAERILAHLRHLGLVFLLRNERAELRAAQVRGHRSVIDAQPDLPPHISGRLKAQGPNEPQMDVNHVARVIRIEVEEEVLAKGFGEGEG